MIQRAVYPAPSYAAFAFVTAVGAALAAPIASAEDPAPAAVLTKQELAARHPGLSPDDIHDGPVPGWYEVVLGGTVQYVTTDGRLLFNGEVIELETRRNLTEARRAEGRAALLAAIDPADEIIFSPENGSVKHRVTVFTDVDCGYCRQLHREMGLYNALGIEVRYVAYPRTGPDTASWATAENVWCSDDRRGLLTKAKLGADVPAVEGCAAPVAEQYELGRRVGVTGTPAIYAENGMQLGGYVPPGDLLRLLEEEKAAAANAH